MMFDASVTCKLGRRVATSEDLRTFGDHCGTGTGWDENLENLFEIRNVYRIPYTFLPPQNPLTNHSTKMYVQSIELNHYSKSLEAKTFKSIKKTKLDDWRLSFAPCFVQSLGKLLEPRGFLACSHGSQPWFSARLAKDKRGSWWCVEISTAWGGCKTYF